MERRSEVTFRGYLITTVAGLVLVGLAARWLMVSPTDGLLAPPARNAKGVGVGFPAAATPVAGGSPERPIVGYRPRQPFETSGLNNVLNHLRWTDGASLEEIGENWKGAGARVAEELNSALPPPGKSDSHRLQILLAKVNHFNYEGEPQHAYEVLEQTRSWLEGSSALAEFGLYTVIYFQGVTSLRLGETDNCVMCRGESSCIIPIAPAAVHTNTTGSRRAVRHFTEYLEKFPDDFTVRWLLNLAHMTLGEYTQKVDTRYLIPLDRFVKSEFDIGKFRDIGHKVGVDRLNMYGAGVMEDLDSDGRLDLVVSTADPVGPMAYYRNKGDGTFEDRSKESALGRQLGGTNLVQMDYNNDGRIDLFVSRGGWFYLPMPQTLLRNDGGGKFSDVTQEAGLLAQLNSPGSRWADYDNDGWLDVLMLAEKQNNRLYHNRGNGTFEDVSAKAGVQSGGLYCKGADWIDYDNDDYPDLFLNNFMGEARLYHNNRNGTFTDVTRSMGIDGPTKGFSCWAWDYDNDGWLDLFATCYDFSIEDVVKGLLGQPHSRLSNRLFHNAGGKRFENRTKQAGLDLVFAAMGSNYGDFDNDGFLDFYLGTGAPDLATLVPNRMFRNVAGQRFADISGSSGTAHLQKGHGVSCADWDNDGDVDLFIEMGGTVPGDRYHNVLFQNPGQGNHWLTVKLVGKKTNRPALGARIKVVAAGDHPLTVQRHVSSGSSFGANPLQQTIGLGKADRVALLEIHWPTSGTTQVFKGLAVNQAIEVTEFAPNYRKLDWKPIPTPK
jgi:FG-GAP-like repeat/ASPIC and UnbV